MNYLISADCVCRGEGTVPAGEGSSARLPCAMCIERYNRNHSLETIRRERDALREAVRNMRDAQHRLDVMRMEESESPNSTNHFDHVAAEDRRDHLTAELYELAGLREATGITHLAYAEKLMRDFISAFDGLVDGKPGCVETLEDAIEAIRREVPQ